jgi:nucleotide-binding universal stress UspA family protein
MSQNQGKPPKVAVWAINPFEEETRPSPAVIAELRRWAEATGHAIQPVHVFYVSPTDAPPQGHESWIKRFIPALEAETAHYIKGMDVPGMLEPKVLVQRGGFTHAAIEVLVQYAQDLGASWILVSSKGRSGIRRMALGSFAETLLIHSPVPVWVFGHGPADLREPDSRRIFFATDFSDVSQAAFARVIEQARALGARVTLFHCINLPEPMVSGAAVMGVSAGFPVDEYVRDQSEWARKRAADWIRFAAQSGVPVEFKLREVVPSIANEIVTEARRESAGIIALASHSGTVGATLLGSHARQVVRQSECPVWVFGPSCEGVSKRPAPQQWVAGAAR